MAKELRHIDISSSPELLKLVQKCETPMSQASYDRRMRTWRFSPLCQQRNEQRPRPNR